MATKYTVDLTIPDAELVEQTLAGNPGFTAERWPASTPGMVTLALNEAAVEHLQRLPEETDWHCEDGALYADGAAYPLTVIHNIEPTETQPCRYCGANVPITRVDGMIQELNGAGQVTCDACRETHP